MRCDYIYGQVERLIQKYQTRDPLELLQALGVIVKETSQYQNLKGYCFVSCQSIYTMLSSFLSDGEKRIVAGHELGHIVLHRNVLKLAPMLDVKLYNMVDDTEYQANLFTADLLIADQDVAELAQNEDLDYFSFCSTLQVTPELMSFKLYSLIHRGQNYNMPLDLDSRFLAK